MHSVSEEMQEVLKKHQQKENQWSQEKAVLDQKIEQLSKLNTKLTVKVESQKKAFRELLKVYTDVKTQNQNNFVSLVRTEFATMQQQPFDGIEALNSVNESHNDGNGRRSAYNDLCLHSDRSKDHSMNDEFAFSRRQSQNTEPGEKAHRAHYNDTAKPHGENGENSKFLDLHEEKHRPKSADGKFENLHLSRFSPARPTRRSPSQIKPSKYDSVQSNDFIIKKKSLSTLNEKLNTMKMEPLLNEIASSSVSDKLTLSRRNSDRYQNHNRNLQIENNLLILKKANGLNSHSLNQQSASNEPTIQPPSLNIDSLDEPSVDDSRPAGLSQNSDCKSVKANTFGKILFTFNNSDFAKKDFNSLSNHNSCESMKARLEENLPKPSQFSNNSKNSVSRLSVQDVDINDTPQVNLTSESHSSRRKNGPHSSQVKDVLIESISDFNKATDHYSYGMSTNRKSLDETSNFHISPKSETIRMTPGPLAHENALESHRRKGSTHSNSDDISNMPSTPKSRGSFLKIVRTDDIAKETAKGASKDNHFSQDENQPKKSTDLTFSRSAYNGENPKAISLLSKPSHTLDLSSNEHQTTTAPQPKPNSSNDHTEEQNFINNSNFTSSDYFQRQSNLPEFKNKLNPLQRNISDIDADDHALQDQNQARAKFNQKLVTSSLSMENGFCSIDQERCQKAIRCFNAMQLKDSDVQETAHQETPQVNVPIPPITEHLSEDRSRSNTEIDTKSISDQNVMHAYKGISFSKFESLENRELEPSHDKNLRMKSTTSLTDNQNPQEEFEFELMDTLAVPIVPQTPEFNIGKVGHFQDLSLIRFKDLQLGKELFKTITSNPESDISGLERLSREPTLDLEYWRKSTNTGSIESQKNTREKSDKASYSESFTDRNYSIHDTDEALTDREQTTHQRTLSNDPYNFKKQDSNTNKFSENSPIEENTPLSHFAQAPPMYAKAPMISEYNQVNEFRIPKPPQSQNHHIELKKSFEENLKIMQSKRGNESSKKELKVLNESEAKPVNQKMPFDQEDRSNNAIKPNRPAITRHARKDSAHSIDANERLSFSEKKPSHIPHLAQNTGNECDLLHSIPQSEDMASRSESRYIEHELLSQTIELNRFSAITGNGNKNSDLFSVTQDRVEISVTNSYNFSVNNESNVKAKETHRDVSPKTSKTVRANLPKINEQSSESEAINSGTMSSQFRMDNMGHATNSEVPSIKQTRSTRHLPSVEEMIPEMERKRIRRSTINSSSIDSRNDVYEKWGTEERSLGIDGTINSNDDKSHMTAKLEVIGELIKKMNASSFGFDPVSSGKNLNVNSNTNIILDNQHMNSNYNDRSAPRLSANSHQSPLEKQFKVYNEPTSNNEHFLRNLKVSPIANHMPDTPPNFSNETKIGVPLFITNGSPTANDNYLYISKTEPKELVLDFAQNRGQKAPKTGDSQLSDINEIHEYNFENKNYKINDDHHPTRHDKAIPFGNFDSKLNDESQYNRHAEKAGVEVGLTHLNHAEKVENIHKRRMVIESSSSDMDSSYSLSESLRERRLEMDPEMRNERHFGHQEFKKCSIESLNEANRKILFKGSPPVHSQASQPITEDRSASQRKRLQPFVDCSRKFTYTRPSSNKLKQMQSDLYKNAPRKNSTNQSSQKIYRSKTQEKSIENVRDRSNPKPEFTNPLQADHSDAYQMSKQKYFQIPFPKPDVKAVKKVEPISICHKYYYSAKYQTGRSPGRYSDLTNRQPKGFPLKNLQTHSRSDLRTYIDPTTNPMPTQRANPISDKYKQDDAAFKKNWTKVATQKPVKCLQPTPKSKASGFTPGSIYPYIVNKQLINIKEKSFDISLCQDIEKICPQYKENNDLRSNHGYHNYESVQPSHPRQSQIDPSSLHASKGESYLFNTELVKKYGKRRQTGRQ